MRRKLRQTQGRRRRSAMPTPLHVDDLPAEGATDNRPPADPEAVDPGAPFEARDPGQTDIEHADEHKGGSVESVPHAEPASAADGFIEPGARDNAGT